ncbi:MAG TPA: S8 family peptidase [Candidatus Aquicultor sp.]|jgi:hypothetical protein
MPQTNLSHIKLEDPPSRLGFTSVTQMGAKKRIPGRGNRQGHADFLRERLSQAWEEAENEFVVTHADREGIYLEFRGAPGYDLVTKSLEDMRSKKARLCNVRIEEELVRNDETGEDEYLRVIYATVFIANDKRQDFFKKLEQYANEESKSGKPRNADLVNSIEDLRKALLVESFWQDDNDLMPGEEPEWCEVWLSSDSDEAIRRFEELLVQQQVNSKTGSIKFPERAVKLVHVNRRQLEDLTRYSDEIAEYRKAKDTAAFWDELPNLEQAEWVEDFSERLHVDGEANTSVCMIDTGVNTGHPMLSPLLDGNDCHCYDSAWGTHDHEGHGTLMAGISGYGNIAELLSGSEPIIVNHVLESVKMLPPQGQNEPKLWGDINAQCVYLAEIRAPERKRINCMAITAEDTRDRGRPSSWSGELDQLTSGVDDGVKRLMVVSAGNITDFNQVANYPENQITDSIHDPAQSWNVLTVGAYTQLDTITDPTLNGYTVIARRNQLSPFTTTSLTWNDRWPIKPEIVMEGGNMAVDDGNFATECADLSLLSTHYQPQSRLLDCFNMTSAATAQAAHLAAKIQARYPDYWPETIRALMVHSAEWPDELKRQFVQNDTKTELKNLLRICGYGVPNEEAALYSASNSLTLIAQAEIKPFEVQGGRGKTCDMHLYDLPWPREVLLGLHDTQVEMRITLSYFIEPGPGEIGWKDRYRYASHALRFDINSPYETEDQFVQRINAAARDEDEGHPGTASASDHWVIGQARDKGSIHSDIWRGSAAELAESHFIAVSPRIGWWRERKHLGKFDNRTRYALVVTIRTPEQEIDVYTPVAQQVGLIVPITTQRNGR